MYRYNTQEKTKNVFIITEPEQWFACAASNLSTNVRSTLLRFDLTSQLKTNETLMKLQLSQVDADIVKSYVIFNNELSIHDATSDFVIISDSTEMVVNNNTIFDTNQSIGQQIYFVKSVEQTQEPTCDFFQYSLEECKQILSEFSNYAQEIIKTKDLELTNIRIINWQSIDDENCKQCILDVTIKASADFAIKLWDELSGELQKYIMNQPESLQPFLKDILSIEVKWV